jgi:hypothetical protein
MPKFAPFEKAILYAFMVYIKSNWELCLPEEKLYDECVKIVQRAVLEELDEMGRLAVQLGKCSVISIDGEDAYYIDEDPKDDN